MEYYSAIKKNEVMSSAATWMDLEITMLSEVSQTEKDRYHMITQVESEVWHNELIYKTETDSLT